MNSRPSTSPVSRPASNPARRRLPCLTATLALLALLTSGSLARADYVENFSCQSKSLKLVNLIGQIEISGYSGDEFIVEIRVAGSDAKPGVLEFHEKDGRNAELVIGFPVKKTRKFVYPELGRNSRTTFNPGRHDHGILSLFGRGKIEVRGSGKGMELWADVTIKVPEGASLELLHGVGSIEAHSVQADLSLAVHSGNVEANEIGGKLSVDTGSGHVDVAGVTDDLLVDTGSGNVRVSDCHGDKTSVDTGSGNVQAFGLVARQIRIDTGSGNAELEGVECKDLGVDTGSGHVEITDLATDAAMVDTGSGLVRMELSRMGPGNFGVDTGSGSITFLMPNHASARVEAETGSGGIGLDVDDAVIERKKRDDVRFTIGSGAAHVTLDAGSGSIRIATR